MIMVIGRVDAKADCHEQARELSLEHVKRSRAEDGCIDHRVSMDAENEHRFVFVEYWRDMAALQTHFDLEASKGFVQNLLPLISSKPEMRLFKADEIPT